MGNLRGVDIAPASHRSDSPSTVNVVRKPTMRDVAEVAGVSPNTVSPRGHLGPGAPYRPAARGEVGGHSSQVAPEPMLTTP